ncbi:MAG: hypothetical protein U0X93_03895 [Anaerolineales bacterium]
MAWREFWRSARSSSRFEGTSIDPQFLQNEALIGFLGLAYLLGVVFDKLADTMLTSPNISCVSSKAKFLGS